VFQQGFENDYSMAADHNLFNRWKPLTPGPWSSRIEDAPSFLSSLWTYGAFTLFGRIART